MHANVRKKQSRGTEKSEASPFSRLDKSAIAFVLVLVAPIRLRVFRPVLFPIAAQITPPADCDRGLAAPRAKLDVELRTFVYGQTLTRCG